MLCQRVLLALGLVQLGLLGGCTSLGASGPSAKSIVRAGNPETPAANGIALVELDSAVIGRLESARKQQSFAEALGDAAVDPSIIGAGDTIDVTMWESPPSVLFGSSISPSGVSYSQAMDLPKQMVGNDGRITIPFVGSLVVAGHTTRQVEQEIVSRLRGKANGPQAIVRLSENEARTVTVLGEVTTSRRMPLTGRGERLLDALAAAGGSRQPVGKSTVQVTRASTTLSMPLDEVIRDPGQNVRLTPGDVVALLYQPFSFTALGASALNAEVPFEATGMSLAQALGRMGGLRDERASARGVFVFRFEDPAVLGPVRGNWTARPDGKVPTVYRLDLSTPASLFVSQNFPVHDKDVVYVSNAPVADFQKFIGIASSLAFSIIGIGSAIN
jgi:polysaccharide biosynthesis/export protein